jgi:hypothetical protein
MTTYVAADLATKPVPAIDQAAIHFGTIAPGVATATGDLLRPLKMPNGLKVGALLVNVRTAFGATAPASIGFSQINGAAPNATTYPSPSTQFAVATDTTFATTGVKVVMPQAGAFLTPNDSYLEVLFGTVATGASGVADFTLISEFTGTK